METQKYTKYVCLLLLSLSTVGVYFVLTNRYVLLIQSLNVPYAPYFSSANSSAEDRPIIETNFTFESRFAEFHPQLPIHIFTQNISAISNTSKLILIGNGFFGERNWGVAIPNRSSQEIMTSLYCPFLSNSCDITTDFNRFNQADAILYHMRDGFDRKLVDQKRQSHQRIVFTLWESPTHSPNLESYRRFFNWTMSYRFKSHVITSYYSGNAYVHTSSEFYQMMLRENVTKKLNLKTIKADHRPSEEVLSKKKLGLAAALISNCGGSSKRLAFIEKLKQYIDVKVYGRCGQACPSSGNCRKYIAENYYFILSFENSLCTEYATEKFFAILEYPVVPVVLGRTNYSYFIPSSGYIDTKDFATMKSLAEFLNKTRYDKENYYSYFSWKKDYVWGLGQFFTPFCDLCLRLHLDSAPSVIDDMQKWWFDGACQAANVLP